MCVHEFTMQIFDAEQFKGKDARFSMSIVQTEHPNFGRLCVFIGFVDNDQWCIELSTGTVKILNRQELHPLIGECNQFITSCCPDELILSTNCWNTLKEIEKIFAKYGNYQC